MGLYCRKVSGSGESSRGQSFFPALLPNELRSFLASFFGVLASVSSSSSAQLHSSTLSSNSGNASLLRHSSTIQDSAWIKQAATQSSKLHTAAVHTPPIWMQSNSIVHSKNRHVQDGGALKADVGDWSVHHHHPSVKHLRANLQQTEHCNATRACIIKGCVLVHKIKTSILNPHKGNVTEQQNQEGTDFLCCWSGPNPSTSAECAGLHQQDRAVNFGRFHFQNGFNFKFRYSPDIAMVAPQDRRSAESLSLQ